MWGVSDPRCHPPEAVPGPLRRGSLTPHLVRTKVTARVLNENLVLPGTEVGLMIIAWSHAVCFCRKPLAAHA
jgi:hypothetical protein